MGNFIFEYEAAIRPGVFLAIFVVVTVWEWLLPRRASLYLRRIRWLGNLGLLVVDIVLLRLLLPVAAVDVAAVAQRNGWGLFSAVGLPSAFAIIGGVVLLDLAVYAQHVAAHHVPLLWRVHRVHHADPDFDVTTGLRFHPIEIILSMLFKFVVIMILGPPLVAVIIFEILLNGVSMFNHGNIALPKPVDTFLRYLLVTPDMHRVHHSVIGNEANCNFGFNIAWWDRLFATYRAQPQAGHGGMAIGLPLQAGYHTSVNLPRMLMLPFKGQLGNTGSTGDH